MKAKYAYEEMEALLTNAGFLICEHMDAGEATDAFLKDYAKEAARAVRDWAFRNTDYPALYSYCKYTNVPSFRTAEAIGMRFAFEYPDETNGKTHVSVMTREEWLTETKQKITTRTGRYSGAEDLSENRQ